MQNEFFGQECKLLRGKPTESSYSRLPITQPSREIEKISSYWEFEVIRSLKLSEVRVTGSLKQITGSKKINKWMGRKGQSSNKVYRNGH